MVFFSNLPMFLSLLWCFVAVRGETSCEVADGVRNASLLQRGEVHEKVAMAADAVTKTLDMKPVLQCLRLTTPHIQHLKYPSDPEEHFEELRNALSPWFDYAAKKFMAKTKNPYHCTEGYCGPWVENHWIQHFLSTWVNHSSKTGSKKRLAEVFGPFIPIFMPYNDLWNANASEYEKMMKVLRKELRPHVAYITVVLHATGLVSNRKKMMKIMDEIPNVVVLSAGGYGHVPIPLFKQPEHVLHGRFFKAMSKRKLLLSYMGSSHHSPKDMRKKMINIVEKEAKSLGVKVHVGFGSADEWHRVAGNSRVSLCPRGFGRTAFHLFEILQLGLIPIHVYMDVPWVPYPDVYEQIGFSTDLKGLPKLMKKINDMDLKELARMEEHIRTLRASHFSPKGMLNQISLFMKNGGSDLRCQKLPETLLGPEWLD